MAEHEKDVRDMSEAPSVSSIPLPWRCRLFGHKRGKPLFWFHVRKEPFWSGWWACARCGRECG